MPDVLVVAYFKINNHCLLGIKCDLLINKKAA